MSGAQGVPPLSTEEAALFLSQLTNQTVGKEYSEQYLHGLTADTRLAFLAKLGVIKNRYEQLQPDQQRTCRMASGAVVFDTRLLSQKAQGLFKSSSSHERTTKNWEDIIRAAASVLQPAFGDEYMGLIAILSEL
jgi:hypothetical protein